MYVTHPSHLRDQKYCGKEACRKASKAASQRRWLSSEKGSGYFGGPENVKRVQEWRKAHPGYWKRGKRKDSNALQDMRITEDIAAQKDKRGSTAIALQDIRFLQVPLLVGLIAALSGTVLQDTLVETTRQFILLGNDILGQADINQKGGRGNGDNKTSYQPGTNAPCAGFFQLDRPSAGAQSPH